MVPHPDRPFADREVDRAKAGRDLGDDLVRCDVDPGHDISFVAGHPHGTVEYDHPLRSVGHIDRRDDLAGVEVDAIDGVSDVVTQAVLPSTSM